MANLKNFDGNPYSNEFTSPNFRPKHQNSQINGETKETVHNIILRRQTRKQS